MPLLAHIFRRKFTRARVSSNPFNPPQRHYLPFSFYSLSDWQRSTSHVDWAKAQFREPIFRDMLAVLYNGRPVASTSHPVDGVQAAYDLGRRVGYDELMARLMLLPMDAPRSTKEVDLDYGADLNHDL